MDEFDREDVAMMIIARQIARKSGLSADADIKTICEHAGVSRKTGYQWADKFRDSDKKEQQMELELAKVKAEKEKLEKELNDLRFENEGRKLAWEIHDVDELLKKKNNIASRKSKKR